MDSSMKQENQNNMKPTNEEIAIESAVVMLSTSTGRNGRWKQPMLNMFLKGAQWAREESVKNLVSFGEYMMSNERRERFKSVSMDNLEERLSQVHDADVQNWKEKFNV